MRQLDLFGSLFGTASAEKKQEEKQRRLKKVEESTPSVSKAEEASPSLVQIAEEKSGVETVDQPEEIILSAELYEEPVIQSQEKCEDSHSENEIGENTFSEHIAIEKPGHAEFTRDDDSGKEKVIDQEQIVPDAPEPQRTGSIIFEDGKITVKVKNRHITPSTSLSLAGSNIETQVELPAESQVELPAEHKEASADTVVIEKGKKEPQKRGRKSLQEIEAEADLIEVPDDEVLFQKKYYSISEVAKWFRVNTSLLRFWENEFEILKPKKNRKGDRLFRPEDVKNLQLIYQLLRQRKYTIEGAKEYIKTNRKKADTELQLTNTLQRFKSFLLDLKTNLQS